MHAVSPILGGVEKGGFFRYTDCQAQPQQKNSELQVQ